MSLKVGNGPKEPQSSFLLHGLKPLCLDRIPLFSLFFLHKTTDGVLLQSVF